jgi:hypothetical protein
MRRPRSTEPRDRMFRGHGRPRARHEAPLGSCGRCLSWTSSLQFNRVADVARRTEHLRVGGLTRAQPRREHPASSNWRKLQQLFEFGEPNQAKCSIADLRAAAIRGIVASKDQQTLELPLGDDDAEGSHQRERPRHCDLPLNVPGPMVYRQGPLTNAMPCGRPAIGQNT